ncbi:MAG: hypothetical protein FK734_10625 [Asgard group archaeon]|nr:hypothetical protein [Asgard group archaeon]
MRKLLFIFAIVLAALTLQAQDVTRNIYANESYEYNNVNVSLVDTASYDVYWNVSSHYPFTWNLAMDIDSVSGVSSIDTLFVFGRIDDSATWTPLDTLVRTSNSETMRVSSTTKVRYRQMRALYNTKDTADVTVDWYYLKIWRE